MAMDTGADPLLAADDDAMAARANAELKRLGIISGS